MSKIEITDEMVERGAEAAFGRLDRAPRFETATPLATIRAALEAALNPPESEIEVTHAMRDAGVKAYWKAYGCPGANFTERHWSGMTAAYRAMERERRKSQWACLKCGRSGEGSEKRCGCSGRMEPWGAEIVPKEKW